MPPKRKAAAKPALERVTRRLRTSPVQSAVSSDESLKSSGQVKTQSAARVRGKTSKAQANPAPETDFSPTAVEEQDDPVDVADQLETSDLVEKENVIGAEARPPPALDDSSKVAELEATAKPKRGGRAKAGALHVEAEKAAGASSIVPASDMHDQAGPVGKLSDVLYTINTPREQIANFAKHQEATKKQTVADAMEHGIEVSTEALHEIRDGLQAFAESVTMRLEACENQLLEINSKQDTMGQLLSVIVQRLAPSLTSGRTSELDRNSLDDHEVEQHHGLESELNGISGMFESTTIVAI